MTTGQLLAYCEGRRDRLLDHVRAFVGCESPSTDKAAVDACGREIARRLEAVGAAVERIPNPAGGDHLRAAIGDGGRQLLLLGHFDTVWPVGQLARMPLQERDGCLFGPGVFDMKAGIAIGVVALEALREAGGLDTVRVLFLLTSDEEIGSPSSRALIEAEASRSDAALVLEPSLPGGALKTARKGCGEFVLTVRGVSAHAGVDPGKGASAIDELAHLILALAALRDLVPGVSVNVGVVEGGSRPNVVADLARAAVDVRAPTATAAAALEAAVRGLAPRDPRTRVEWSGGFGRPPLERTEAVGRLFDAARVLSLEMGRPLEEGSTGGGSDGNFTAALGVPTLDGLGAVGDGAHALHEHVVIEALPWRAALVAGLLRRLVADGRMK